MPLSTKLSAVNIMLSVIGETKVASLASGDTDAELAEEILDEISMEVQSMGWRFNEEERTVTADASGNIHIPSNALNVDTKDRRYNHYVQRGTRLYNALEGTYNIAHDVELQLTLLLDFEELPQPARRYIEVRAARTFQKRTLGATEVDGFTADEENKAWLAFLDYTSSTNDHNIFNNPEMSDNINRTIGGGVSWLS